jgi:ankyrin repeat protein
VHDRFCREFGAGFGESENRELYDAYRLEVIRLHLNKAIDVNAPDADGVTPIMLSASRGWLEVMQVLIERGALISAMDDHGQTALMYVVHGRGNEEALLMLIEHGAKVNAKDHKGRTALMHAARYGRLEVVQLLVKRGADVSAVDNDGQRTADLLKSDLRHIQDDGLMQEPRGARNGTGLYLDKDEMERILAFLEGRPIPPRRRLTFN